VNNKGIPAVRAGQQNDTYKKETQSNEYKTLNNYPPVPSVGQSTYYGTLYGPTIETVVQGQCTLGQQMASLSIQVDKALQNTYKLRRRPIDAVLASDENKAMIYKKIYDYGPPEEMRYFANSQGELIVTIIDIADGKYSLVVIEIEKNCVFLHSSEIKGDKVYNALIQIGVRFNPQITKTWAVKALNDYVNKKIHESEKIIFMSGHAGWEDGKFNCYETRCYLDAVRPKLTLPILNKYFNKEAANRARITDYAVLLQRIHDPKLRLVFALIPLGGILFSVLQEKNIYEPFVTNLILMNEEQDIREILYYLQVFNRNELYAMNLDGSDKNNKNLIESCKDEVVVVAGLRYKEMSAYKSKKISNNLRVFAKKAMNRSGLNYGETPFKAVVVLFSNERIAEKGVRNVFIDKDFFETSNLLDTPVWDGIQATFALFIKYVEEHWKDVQKIITAEYRAVTRTERLWKVLLALVEEFWNSFGTSITSVLNLPEGLDPSFLWQEDECYLEDAVDTIASALRMASRLVKAVPKENADGCEAFLYDEEYIWILPEKFSEIVETYVGLGQKERLLLGAKEAGALLASEYGGYTSRLQINKVRKEYYKFQRNAFNRIGYTDLITLLNGGSNEC